MRDPNEKGEPRVSLGEATCVEGGEHCARTELQTYFRELYLGFDGIGSLAFSPGLLQLL